MFCKNCGQQLQDEYKVCPHCGTPVEVQAPVTEAAAAQTVDANEPFENFPTPVAQPAQQPVNQEPAQPTQPAKKNIFAIIGFALSFFAYFTGIAPIALGIIGLIFADKKYNGEGKKMAIAAIVIGAILFIVSYILSYIYTYSYFLTLFEQFYQIPN